MNRLGRRRGRSCRGCVGGVGTGQKERPEVDEKKTIKGKCTENHGTAVIVKKTPPSKYATERIQETRGGRGEENR